MDYDKESINLETWPAPVDLPSSEKAVSDMQVIIDAIEAVREIKTEYGIKPREILQISLTDENGNPYPLSDQGKTLLCGMAKTELVDLKPGEDILTRPIPKASVLASLNDLVDTEAELEKLRKEKERLEKEIARASKMLANPGFVAKAPKEKIEQEKAKLASYQDQLLQVQKQLEK
jgi:valyl-tRNA synthetase